MRMALRATTGHRLDEPGSTFVDAAEGTAPRDGYDAVYVPQIVHYAGDIDVHDLAFERDGRLVFANTLFSCLAAVSETYSFKPDRPEAALVVSVKQRQLLVAMDDVDRWLSTCALT
jgi:hypothetical protein